MSTYAYGDKVTFIDDTGKVHSALIINVVDAGEAGLHYVIWLPGFGVLRHARRAKDLDPGWLVTA